MHKSGDPQGLAPFVFATVQAAYAETLGFKILDAGIKDHVVGLSALHELFHA